MASPDAHDPFEDATLTGTLTTEDGRHHWEIDGFCDSDDGSIFRIRFMAPQPGGYRYIVTYRQGGFQKGATGTLQAIDAHRRGTIGVDPKYSWHFIWESRQTGQLGMEDPISEPPSSLPIKKPGNPLYRAGRS